MRYKYLIIFFFLLFFIELPLLYIYYTGQERAIEKKITQIELSENLVVSRDNPKYLSLNMEKGIIYQIIMSSTRRVNMSVAAQNEFIAWQIDPENIKPLEFFYQSEKVDFLFVPKETNTYYFIFETDPLLASNASVSLEISSVYVEVVREDIINTIEPILMGTSVITVLLFMLSILPKGGLSKKKLAKTFYVLSEEGKTHDLKYLKEFRGFTDHEIKVLSVMATKGRVTEKEIPNLFDIPTFYNLYKMGFIEKITEL